MQTVTEDVSRRDFFRGRISRTASEPGGWLQIDELSAGAGDVFWDGWADEAGVFVAGDDGVIFHFDGTEWKRQPVSAPVPVHSLWGTSRNDLWAVGWMGLVLHHDGRVWTKVRGCVTNEGGKYSDASENAPLFGVAGLPNGQAWAVGDRGTILHFDGQDWVSENSGVRAHLRCVVILPDGRVLAAGGDGIVLIRNEDGQWHKQSCPIHSNFTSALPLEDNTVLLAGGRYFVDANGFRGDLVLWDGKSFKTLFAEKTFSRFRALAAYKHGAILVGDAGQMHLLGHDGIERLDSGTNHDLLGIVTLATGEVVSVGDFGTALTANATALENFKPYVATREAATLWEPVASGTDRQLWGVWHDTRQDELFACGEEGTVLVFDRGKWEALPPVNDLGIHALSRAPDGGLLAAGQMGEIHQFDGAKWRKVYDLHMDVTILSLWSDGSTFFAAGDEGLVLCKTPESADWVRAASGTKSALYGLWGPDDRHILAVGDFGLVQRWNGECWDEFNAGTEYFLFDVWGRALNDIFVVGLSGTIGHFDGTRWTITPARARADLLAVTGNDREVIAVGAAGTIYRHDGTVWRRDPGGTDVGLRAVSTTPDGGFIAAGDRGTLIVRLP